MSQEKTPTIEQKSTFASKTKDGSDVEFVATIKFYINPAGDVKINAPGSASSQISSGPRGPSTGDDSVNRAKPPSGTADPNDTQIKKDIAQEGDKGLDGNVKFREEKTVQQPKEGNKFQSNKEIDKQIPRIQGDCPISQFIPDPCKAIDDLTKSVRAFFAPQSCPPCPNETTADLPPVAVSQDMPKPTYISGEMDNAKHKSEMEIMEKELKYEV